MPSKGPITLQTDLLRKAASLPDLRLRVCTDVSSDSGDSSRETPSRPPAPRRHTYATVQERRKSCQGSCSVDNVHVAVQRRC